ncbi:hypothetical protein Hanom_Chr05g00417861 [Helianthus anomalus]
MGKRFIKPDYNQNSALNDPQRRFAPRARLDILELCSYKLRYTRYYSMRIPTCLLFSVIAPSRTIYAYTTFIMKIMSGRINITQAQLEALVQAQVAAAVAAAQAGSIPCSIDSH